jgi:hypothetical protein
VSEALSYTNRMGDVYYLQAKPGKTGQIRYSFARKPTGAPVEHLPEGYEIREHPETGQVVVRRSKASVILPLEKTLLENTILDQTDGLLFIVDVDARSLVVYTSDLDASEAEARVNLLRQFAPMDADTARKMAADIVASATYSKMMRFTLIDPKARHFNVDRWCFSGRIDDWYFLEGDQPLAVLAEKYVRHLGQDSFFDLM